LTEPQAIEGQQTSTASIGKHVLVELHRWDETSRHIFPLYLSRAINFIALYDADTDPDWLQRTLWAAFQQDSDEVKMLAVIDRKGRIVFHALAFVDTHVKFGRVILWLQVQQDKAAKQTQITEAIWAVIKGWARRKGIRHVMITTDSEAKERTYRMFYGFEIHRRIMVKELETNGA
jgi:hypothetical protein